jgi:tRNA (mo5U34)-methyltransferase
VVTPGHFDTARECARVPLPDRLDGLRCLDVGSCDGFWAFELERRGAREVVGIDVDDLRTVDWPGNTPLHRILDVGADGGRRRAAFELARDALGSRVERLSLSVYELDPEHVGSFDFVFMGSILAYLRDPVGALERIRRVLRGQLLSVDLISPKLTLAHPRQPIARLEARGYYLWWVVNLAGYRRLFDAAGYRTVAAGRPFRLRAGAGFALATPRSSGPLRRLLERVPRHIGVPSAWVLASSDEPTPRDSIVAGGRPWLRNPARTQHPPSASSAFARPPRVS